MASYLINVDGDDHTIENKDLTTLDVHKIDISNFHVLQNNKAYQVELIDSDFFNKELTLNINGTKYSLKIEDGYDQMVKKMGLLTSSSQKLNDVKAPMPGLIVDVLVSEGQEIHEGDQLIVLSAMKMENILLATGDGVIKSIKVTKEDAVEKGQLIIEME